jgi:hypothetical protein
MNAQHGMPRVRQRVRVVGGIKRWYQTTISGYHKSLILRQLWVRSGLPVGTARNFNSPANSIAVD